MSRLVLDSSAVLALLRGEPGSDTVDAVRDRAVISAANLCEVLTRQMELGWVRDRAVAAFADLDIVVAEVTFADAVVAADLRRSTRSAGLSLGDRLCLALALRESQSVLTADRDWSKVDVGVEVRLIR